MAEESSIVRGAMRDAFPGMDLSPIRVTIFDGSYVESWHARLSHGESLVRISAGMSFPSDDDRASTFTVDSEIRHPGFAPQRGGVGRKDVILAQADVDHRDRAVREIIAAAKWTAAASVVVGEHAPRGVGVAQVAHRVPGGLSGEREFMVRLWSHEPRIVNTVRARVGADLTCSPDLDDVAAISVPGNGWESYPSLFASEQIRDFFL